MAQINSTLLTIMESLYYHHSNDHPDITFSSMSMLPITPSPRYWCAWPLFHTLDHICNFLNLVVAPPMSSASCGDPTFFHAGPATYTHCYSILQWTFSIKFTCYYQSNNLSPILFFITWSKWFLANFGWLSSVRWLYNLRSLFLFILINTINF